MSVPVENCAVFTGSMSSNNQDGRAVDTKSLEKDVDVSHCNSSSSQTCVTDATGDECAKRENALKHGLTANALLSQVVRHERLNRLLHRLREEHQPRTITEELLLREIARHAAVLDITEQAEPAVMRQSVLAVDQLVVTEDTTAEDLRLTAAVMAEPLERCARYRRGHEKAMYQALDKLRLLRARPAENCSPVADVTSGRFSTTEACELYLKQYQFSSLWRCPSCQSGKGHWLQRRKVWECAGCSKQYGLRFGTVFEHSPLPLTTWFHAIRQYAARTDVSAAALADMIGIKRLGTARAMLNRIRGAVFSHDVEHGLAGLLAYPLMSFQHGRTLRETAGDDDVNRECGLPLNVE